MRSEIRGQIEMAGSAYLQITQSSIDSGALPCIAHNGGMGIALEVLFISTLASNVVTGNGTFLYSSVAYFNSAPFTLNINQTLAASLSGGAGALPIGTENAKNLIYRATTPAVWTGFGGAPTNVNLALDRLVATTAVHIARTDNPHSVTLVQLEHYDKNTDEQAPGYGTKGEPTRDEIESWGDRYDWDADDHAAIDTNLGEEAPGYGTKGEPTRDEIESWGDRYDWDQDDHALIIHTDNVGITSEDDPQVGAIASNSVPRWDNEKLVTSSIYYDPINDRIGIGTASPGRKLTVAGGDIELDSSWNAIRSTGRLHIQSGVGEPLYLNPWGNVTHVGGGIGGAGNLAVSGGIGIGFDFSAELWPVYRLDVGGGNARIREKLYLGSYEIITSDDRTKFNEQPLEYGLAQVMALEPKRYDRAEWEIDPETEEMVIHPEKTTNAIGLLAQEVQKVIPEAVHIPEDENRELWGISYDTIIPVLVKAIQEQQAQIETMKQDIQTLMARNAP